MNSSRVSACRGRDTALSPKPKRDQRRRRSNPNRRTWATRSWLPTNSVSPAAHQSPSISRAKPPSVSIWAVNQRLLGLAAGC